MQKNRLNSKIVPTIQEKRYYTLQLLESSVMSGSKVSINTVNKKEITKLSSEKFFYNNDNIETYCIFDERPKISLLKSLGWYREDGPIPIIAYIPTHLLYKIKRVRQLSEENKLEVVTTTNINNYDVIKGQQLKDLVKEGISDDYILKPLDIVRGTLIDIEYDFLPNIYTLETGENGLPKLTTKPDPLGVTNTFFVTEVRVDPISLNYIANLMPYRFEAESQTETDTTNETYIKFDTEDYGM